MLKLILASSLLFFNAYSAACESNHMTTGSLNKTEWTLSEYKCPRGCSSILKNLFNNQLGQSIDLKGAAPWTSGTADACQQISHRFIQNHSNRLISIDEEASVLIYE